MTSHITSLLPLPSYLIHLTKHKTQAEPDKYSLFPQQGNRPDAKKLPIPRRVFYSLLSLSPSVLSALSLAPPRPWYSFLSFLFFPVHR
ncbi:unnamed protein product [Periconia digitata]|uniref:Uncharacterized protein n=1 Tax=Periconia digitata TaxID=1303443 RepID=A0A9W4XDW2_9PLEO|nr:unnamed protein product [Periconia digitata]